MSIVLSILQGILLVVLALFAVGFVTFFFQLGMGLVNHASLALLGVPSWLRWILLFPALVLTALALVLMFNLIFWIGDLFGTTFIGSAWTWGTTFIQSIIVPSTIVTTGFIVTPKGRRWIAIILMVVIWIWLVGTLFDPDSGALRDFEFLFHAALIVAALSAAYATIKAWALAPLLQLVEAEMKQQA